MHYVNDSMVLDRNYISMKILSFYLSRFICSRINEYFISWYLRFTKMNTIHMMLAKDNKLLHAVFRMLMLEKQANNVGWCGMHNTPVDECVYDSRCQFMLVNNSKLDSNCYFKIINIDKTRRNLITKSECAV